MKPISPSKLIGRFEPVLIQMPKWMYGGNPSGLAGFCGWRIELHDAPKRLWSAQTREAADGAPPALVRLRYLAASGVDQNEVMYDPVLDLASRDHLQVEGMLEVAFEQDAQFAASEQRTFSTTLYNIRSLIMATPTAEELRELLPRIVEQRVRPALPRSSVWLVDTPNDWLPMRYGIARALLRGDDALTPADANGTTFRSSQHLFDDTSLGLASYFTPLFASLTPYVWGFAALRAGGMILLDFGQVIDGDPRSRERLLTRLSSRADRNERDHERPALKRTAFGAALSWWCSRLNVLFAEATNLANYSHRDKIFSPQMHVEKLLSLEQFFRHCESIATSGTDTHQRRTMMFAALETLAGIAPTLRWQASYDFVKVEQMLCQLRATMSDGVQAVLLPRAERAVAALRSLVDGFFIEARRDRSGDIFLLDDRGVSRPVAANVAVRLWLRVLRNSQHGFDRDQSLQTRDLLAIHDGRFPSELPDIAWFFLLYLMAFPESMRRARPTSSA